MDLVHLLVELISLLIGRGIVKVAAVNGGLLDYLLFFMIAFAMSFIAVLVDGRCAVLDLSEICEAD